MWNKERNVVRDFYFLQYLLIQEYTHWWHCFDKLLQGHKIYLRPVLCFHQDLVFLTGEWDHCASILQHIPKILTEFKVWTVVWKLCLTFYEPLFHNVSLFLLSSWNIPKTSEEKKIQWWNNLDIEEVQVSQLTSFFRNTTWTRATGDPRIQHCPHQLVQQALGMVGGHFICLSSHPDATILMNRTNLDSSDHVTFLCFRFHFLCSLAN